MIVEWWFWAGSATHPAVPTQMLLYMLKERSEKQAHVRSQGISPLLRDHI